MNKFTCALLSLFITVSSYASFPIAGKKLFRNPETFSMKLNPSGSLILSYAQGEDENFFELIEPQKEKSYVVLSVPFDRDFRLIDYQWVDNRTIYINLEKRKGFLHLDVSGDVPTTEFREIKSKGYLVSSLPLEDGLVLFSLDIGKYDTKHFLTKVPIQELENDTAQSRNYENLSLKGGLLYFYDAVNDGYMSTTVKNDKLTFWIRGSKDSKWIDFWTIDKAIDFTPVGFLTKDKLAVLTNQDEDLVSLREFDLDKQKLGKVLFRHPMYDLVSAELEPLGAGIKSVSYIDHGTPTTDYFAIDSKKRKASMARTFKNQQSVVVSSNKDSSKQIVLVQSSDNPGKYYLYESASNTAQYLNDKSPHLSPYTLAKSETLKVTVEDNVNVESILTRPSGVGNGVLLVYPHGGPIGVRDYAVYDRKVQYLASRGYSILMINFRGSSGFGKEFLERGKGQFGQLIEKDITAVVDTVKRQHKFKSTCSIGSSYGGYSAVMLAIKNPKEYQCVIAMFGVYDLPLLFNASNYETRKENRERISEIVGELDDSLKTVSPFYLAQSLHTPTLLIAGEDDEIAYPEHTNRMKYRLEQLSKDVETIFYRNVAHGHHKLSGENHQFAYIDDFIRRKLKLADISDEESKPALAHDAIIIADAHNFGSFLPKDFPKALRYYRKAAKLGESRAMFNIGSFYHQGKVVEEDIDKAIPWYKKSSDAGFSEASYRLASLSRDGQHVPKDLEYAYRKMSLAVEQDENNSLAEIGVTRAVCVGQGTDVEAENCLNRLFFVDEPLKSAGKLRGKARRAWESTMSQVFLTNEFDSENKVRLRRLAQAEFKLSVLDINAKERAFGLYAARNKNTKTKVLSKKTLSVPATKGTTFGATLSFHSDNVADQIQKHWSMVKYTWILPEAISNWNEWGYRTVSEKEELDLKFTLSEDYELIAGNWTLQVYNLNDQLLYEKTFATK